MAKRMCIGECGTEVSGRRKRCSACRREQTNRLSLRRYHELRGQDVRDYEHLDELPLVDYSQGGSARPPDPNAPARPYRAPLQHDRTRWVQHQAAMKSGAEDELADMRSWDEVTNRQPDNRVTFPPPNLGHSDPFGRRSSRYAGQPIDNPAAEGMAFTRSTASGERALYRHVGGPR
jgi:hypothetical protein